MENLSSLMKNQAKISIPKNKSKFMVDLQRQITEDTDREYARYLFLSDLFEKVVKQSNAKTPPKWHAKNRYEIHNIFERFLLASANVKSKIPEKFMDDPILKPACDEQTSAVYELMEKEFIMKKNSSELSKNLVSQIKKSIEEFLREGKKNSYEFPNTQMIVRLGKNHDIFIYGKFSNNLSRKRLQVLRNKADIYLSNLFDENSVECDDEEFLLIIDQYILKMMLRYECLMPGGQQWGFSTEMYENLHHNFNVQLECFSSPKNSHLMLVDDVSRKPEIGFCSLFKDTDEIFGSVGNFFELDLVEYMKKINLGKTANTVGFCVNPPYVESVMIKCMSAITEFLDRCKATGDLFPVIVFNIPNWEDSEALINACKSPYLVYQEKMGKARHYYVNNNELDSFGEYKKLISPFESRIFLFALDSAKCQKMTLLTKGYKD